MKYGYARVSTDGQSVDAQVRQLTKAGCKKVFREVASGAKTDRAQLRRLLDQVEAGDVVTVTRLDRLARSTRDLLNTLATITAKEAGFRSLGDTWADTTTPGEHQDPWGVWRPDETTAEISWFGGEVLGVRGGRHRNPVGQSLADRHQSHGVAARSGADGIHAPRTSRCDSGRHGLGGHPPL